MGEDHIVPGNADDRLARLEAENRELRMQLAVTTGIRKPLVGMPQSPPGGLLPTVSVVALAGILLGATVIFPPWLKVWTQRYNVLYFSEWSKDYRSEFAGFDYVFSEEKWRVLERPENLNSGAMFDQTNYRLYWPLLFIEWFVILFFTAIGCYVMYKHSAQASPT